MNGYSGAFAANTAAAEGEYVVHAQAPADWTPSLWAWSSTEGTNVFDAWPGQELTADADNAGWFFFAVPDTTDNIIISNAGTPQTVDVPVEARELWITVAEAGADGKYLADVVYEAPEGFVVAGAEEAAVEEAPVEAAAETEVPKTGVVSLGLIYGLGALATGAVVLKKRSK